MSWNLNMPLRICRMGSANTKCTERENARTIWSFSAFHWTMMAVVANRVDAGEMVRAGSLNLVPHDLTWCGSEVELGPQGTVAGGS
jgi:hypothetical protein